VSVLVSPRIVAPFTAKEPPIVALAVTVILFGKPIVTLLLVTTVSTSFAVPLKVNVSVPTTTESVPVSPAILRDGVPTEATAVSTYNFVVASAEFVGVARLVILFDPMLTTPDIVPPLTVKNAVLLSTVSDSQNVPL